MLEISCKDFPIQNEFKFLSLKLQLEVEIRRVHKPLQHEVENETDKHRCGSPQASERTVALNPVWQLDGADDSSHDRAEADSCHRCQWCMSRLGSGEWEGHVTAGVQRRGSGRVGQGPQVTEGGWGSWPRWPRVEGQCRSRSRAGSRPVLGTEPQPGGAAHQGAKCSARGQPCF